MAIAQFGHSYTQMHAHTQKETDGKRKIFILFYEIEDKACVQSEAVKNRILPSHCIKPNIRR